MQNTDHAAARIRAAADALLVVLPRSARPARMDMRAALRDPAGWVGALGALEAAAAFALAQDAIDAGTPAERALAQRLADGAIAAIGA